MITTIKNIDTNEIVEINMTDPRTGCDWSGGFIGNANDGTGKIGDLLHCDDDDAVYQGDTETVQWWVDYAKSYEEADHAAHEAEQESSLDDDEINAIKTLCMEGVEFNGLVSALEDYVDMLISK